MIFKKITFLIASYLTLLNILSCAFSNNSYSGFSCNRIPAYENRSLYQNSPKDKSVYFSVQYDNHIKNTYRGRSLIFSKNERCSIKEIHAFNLFSLDKKTIQIFNKYNNDDWEHMLSTRDRAGFDYQFAYNPGQYVLLLAEQYNFYQIPSYISYLKKEFGDIAFEQYMRTLVQRLRNDTEFRNLLKKIQGNPGNVIRKIVEKIDKDKADRIAFEKRKAIKRAAEEKAKKDQAAMLKEEHGHDPSQFLKECHELIKTSEQMRDDLQLLQDRAMKKGDIFMAEIYQQRINALEEAILHNNAIIVQDYNLPQVLIEELGNSSFFDPATLLRCQGTHIQQQLHKEIIGVLQSAAMYKQEYKGAGFIDNAMLATMQFGTIAYSLNTQGYIEQSMRWVDVLHCLADCTVGFVKGSVQAIQRNGDALIGMANPVEAGKNIGICLYHAISELMKINQIITEGRQRNAVDWAHKYVNKEGYDYKDLLQDVLMTYDINDQTVEQLKQHIPQLLLDAPKNFQNASIEEKACMIGNVATEALLIAFTKKFMPMAVRGLTTTVGIPVSTLEVFGPFVKETVYTTVGIGLIKGEHYVRGAVELLQSFPKIAQAEYSLYQNIEKAGQYAQQLKQYAGELAASIKFRCSKHPLAQAMTEAGLPHTFIPEAEALVLKTEQTAQGTKYIDKFGTAWSRGQKEQWLIEFSAEHEKFLAFMLDQEKGIHSAIEFDQAMARAIEVGVADKGLPYYMFRRVPQHLKFYFDHMKFDIENLSKTITTSFGGIRGKCSFSVEELRHIFEPLFRSDKNGVLKKIHGFHHDFLGILERSGLVKLKNKVMGVGGAYKADVIINGVADTKTFFPVEWSREKVLKKIIEVVEKPQGVKIELDLTKIFTGFTSEGIEIKVKIGANGSLLTAFPVIE